MGEWFQRALLLSADPPAGPPAGGASAPDMLQLLFPLLAIGVIFYFVLFRPQQRERKKMDQMLKALKKNDRVVTIGGVIGTIVNIEPDSKIVTLKVDDNSRIVFQRWAIKEAYVEGKEASSAKEIAGS
jgi:preprotein translocase subunit YajC